MKDSSGCDHGTKPFIWWSQDKDIEVSGETVAYWRKKDIEADGNNLQKSSIRKRMYLHKLTL